MSVRFSNWAERPAYRIIAIPVLIVISVLLAQQIQSQPALMLGAIGAAFGLALVIWRPYWALIALLALNPFNLMLATAVAGVSHYPLGVASNWKDALLVALVLRGVAGQLHEGGLRIPSSLGDRFLIVFVAMHVCYLALAPDFQAGVYSLARHIEGPLLFLAIIALKPPRPVIRACVVAVLLPALVMSVGAIVERVPGPRFVTFWGGYVPGPASSSYAGDGRFYRSGSFFGTPLLLGFFLAAAAPFSVALLRAHRKGLRRLALATALTGIVALALTVTRTAYIGGGLGLLVAATTGLRRGWRFIALWTAVVVSAGVILSYAAGNPLLTKPDEGNAHLTSLQFDIQRISDRPLLGFGLGTTDAVRYRFGSYQLIGASESNYMAQALELGIPGLLLYLGSLISLGWRLRNARRELTERDPEGALFAAGALAALVGVAGAGLFLGLVELPVEAFVWGSGALAISAVALLQGTDTVVGHDAEALGAPAARASIPS
jgi:hypothetical protein